MLSKCVVVGEKDAAKVKALVAKRLHAQGFSQQDISGTLDITQPMVSRYLKQSFGDKRLDMIAEQVLGMVARPKKAVFSCIVSSDAIPGGREYFISTKDSIMPNEKSCIISCLADGIEMLKGKNLAPLLPKVKVNMAMALENARTKQDIAAIPSGLVFMNGMLKNYSEPEFGSSSHLASILMYAQSINNEIRSVMNIKSDKAVLNKIRKSGLRHYFFHDGYKTGKKRFDILIHRGSFGIEPTTYIFGKDAKEIARKCLSLK